MKRPLLCLMALGAVACLSASASASHQPARLDLASDATVTAVAPVAAPIQLAQHCYPPRYRGHHHHHGPGYGYGGYGRGYRPARYQYYRGGPVGYRSFGYGNSLYGYGPGLNVGRGGGFGLYIGF